MTDFEDALEEKECIRAFAMAAQLGDWEALSKGLEEHPLLARERYEGLTALMRAARLSGDNGVKCVTLLLPHSMAWARANRKHSQHTPLMMAASRGHTQIVQLLLPLSVVGAVDSDGNTALMHAASNGHDECVRLLRSQSDLSQRDNDKGRTALMLAAKFGNLACVKLLLDGSEVDAVDQSPQEHSAFELALRTRNMECADALGAYGDARRALALLKKAESTRGVASGPPSTAGNGGLVPPGSATTQSSTKSRPADSSLGDHSQEGSLLTNPENPDPDADMAAVLAMLDVWARGLPQTVACVERDVLKRSLSLRTGGRALASETEPTTGSECQSTVPTESSSSTRSSGAVNPQRARRGGRL